MHKPVIGVYWYNPTTDAAGSYLTRSVTDAKAHAKACIQQGCKVEVRYEMTGLPVHPETEEPA